MRRAQRGSAVAVEAVIIVPALVVFVALLILLARNALADQAVGSAAVQAARAASIERTVPDAVAAAGAAASAALRDSGVDCVGQHVDVDASGLTTRIGAPGVVRVTVTCTIQHDLAFPGFPDSRTASFTRTSPVDTYRGR